MPDDFLDTRLTERRNPAHRRHRRRLAAGDRGSHRRGRRGRSRRGRRRPHRAGRRRSSLVEAAFRAGGRLVYVGAGTSGRLGVLDAAECPPTFGTPPEMVIAVIAGGAPALVRSIEGAEDDVNAGIAAMDERRVNANDIVVGIAASGTTPYVRAALGRAAGAWRPHGARHLLGAARRAPRHLRRHRVRAGGPRGRHRLHPHESGHRHQAGAQHASPPAP